MRTSSSFAHLRSLSALQSLVDTAIELPVLPATFFPKEFEPTIARRVLLTQERFDLVKEMFEALRLGEDNVPGTPHSGMILSGPNGVGKTVDSYLLMSVLYVNGAVLIYVVRLRSFPNPF